MRKIELNDDFETILICAERYALGRESYMPSLVIDYITPLLPHLSDRAIAVLNNDLENADETDKRIDGYTVAGSRHGAFGDDLIDKPGWIKFWESVKTEKEKRGGKAHGQ